MSHIHDMNCLDCKKPFQDNQPMMPVEGGYVCECCMVDRRRAIRETAEQSPADGASRPEKGNGIL